ncbi:MAG: flavodoxin [Prevotella sp.]|nr:flavodoxin [Prevotella sp.]
MKRITGLIAMLMAGLALATATITGRSQHKTTNKTAETMDNGNGKILIVFFSHAGENYSVGYINEGNTKIVAKYIKEVTDGDTFEIVAEKNYDMPYSDLIKIAKQEAYDGELPGFKGSIGNIGDYDTVFIGGPIWWGTYPQVMFTFFRKYNLNGKTIIPFTTHEGSGMASVVSDLRKIYPKANIRSPFSIYGHEVRTGRTKVEKWLKELGYGK